MSTEGFANPIYIAEKVLTSSSACILASNGAKRFAEKHGFKQVPTSKLLAPETKAAYEEWRKGTSRSQAINEATLGGKPQPNSNVILCRISWLFSYNLA